MYAASYDKDNTTIVVNESNMALDTSYSITSNNDDVSFKAYSFTFKKTKALTITTKNKTSSRFFLADIAIRVA